MPRCLEKNHPGVVSSAGVDPQDTGVSAGATGDTTRIAEVTGQMHQAAPQRPQSIVLNPLPRLLGCTVKQSFRRDTLFTDRDLRQAMTIARTDSPLHDFKPLTPAMTHQLDNLLNIQRPELGQSAAHPLQQWLKVGPTTSVKRDTKIIRVVPQSIRQE